MKPDLPPAIATPAEAQWVEGELVRSLMRTQRNTQLVGLILVPIFLGVLWQEARHILLALWAVAALSGAAARFTLIRAYKREVMNREIELRRRADTDATDLHATFHQARHDGALQLGRAQASVTSHCDSAGTLLSCERGE